MSYVDDLARFADSVDIVTANDFERVWQSLTEYLVRAYDAHVIELLREHRVQRQRGLMTFKKTKSTRDWTERTMDDSGRYEGYVSYAFEKALNLWLIDPANERTLDKVPCPLDLWQEHQMRGDIVHYIDVDGTTTDPVRTRTEILLPLKLDGSNVPIGLLNIECRSTIRINGAKKHGLTTLARSVARLTHLHSIDEIRRQGTERSIHKIELRAHNAGRRRVFLAFSSRADPEVVIVMREVLSRHLHKDDVYCWTEDSQSGGVMSKIAREITNSEVVCCYGRR